MHKLKTQIERVIDSISDPIQKKKYRYGYIIFLKAVKAAGREISPEILYSPTITDILQTTLNLSRSSARARASEIRKITNLLEGNGVLSPPLDLYVGLGYPDAFTLCGTRSFWKRFRSEVIKSRIGPASLTSEFLSGFVDRLRDEGKLVSRSRYESFKTEWDRWKTNHGLAVPDLPPWESKRDSYHLPWKSFPGHLRQPLQLWLQSDSRKGHARKESTVKVYRNLVERYFGYLSTENTAVIPTLSLEDLVTAKNIHGFLCWRRNRRQESPKKTWTSTLLIEAGILAQLLEHLGKNEEAAQIRRWTSDQEIESSRVPLTGPSFADLIEASENLLRTALALPNGRNRDLAVRDGLIFLDAVLSGKSPQDLAKRSVEDLREEWPDSLQPLLEIYLEGVRPHLASRRNTQQAVWIGQGGRPLSGASVRTLLQKIIHSVIAQPVTPKWIEEAWLGEYLRTHPDDIITPSSHLACHPLTVHAKGERLEKISAIERLDETFQGVYAQ